MRRPQGYAIIMDPSMPQPIERDTFTCFHCNTIVLIEPPPAPPVGGFCRLCMRDICTKCTDYGACTPFEKKLEKMEARERLLKAAGI
jgi:hypothetical protein